MCWGAAGLKLCVQPSSDFDGFVVKKKKKAHWGAWNPGSPKAKISKKVTNCEELMGKRLNEHPYASSRKSGVADIYT